MIQTDQANIGWSGHSPWMRSMDHSTKTMVSEAYDDTVHEALSRGVGIDTAHKEGLTAAAMFLASLVGIEDATARTKVQALGLRPE